MTANAPALVSGDISSPFYPVLFTQGGTDVFAWFLLVPRTEAHSKGSFHQA